MSYPRRIISLTLLFALYGHTTRGSDFPETLVGASTVTVSAYPSDGVVLGQGWDSFLERKTGGACVTGSILPFAGQEISYKLEKIEDIEQVFNSLQVSASAKFKAFGVSADVSTSFSKSLRVDNRALNMMASVKVDRGGAYLAPDFTSPSGSSDSVSKPIPEAGATPPTAAETEAVQSAPQETDENAVIDGIDLTGATLQLLGPRTVSGGGLRLTDEALSALAKDGVKLPPQQATALPVASQQQIARSEAEAFNDKLPNFRRLCGDHFVGAIRTGGELFGVMNILESSREKREALAVALKIKGLTAEGSASLNTSLVEIQKNNGLRFVSFQRGGHSNILATTLDEFVGIVRNFASTKGFVHHPYSIHTLAYNSLENWPSSVQDPSRQTEYLNQLANSYVRFTQLKESYDDVLVDFQSPAVKIEIGGPSIPEDANSPRVTKITAAIPDYEIEKFGKIDLLFDISMNIHNLVKVYADYLQDCFLNNNCKIEQGLQFASGYNAILGKQTSFLLNEAINPKNIDFNTFTATSSILATDAAAGASALPAISVDEVRKLAVNQECDQFEGSRTTVGSSVGPEVHLMLKSDVAKRLNSLSLSFGTEAALKSITSGPLFYAPVEFAGDVIYCQVANQNTSLENVDVFKRRLNPFALYYQLLAQLPPVVGEIPFDTLINTTARLQNTNGTIVPVAPTENSPSVQRDILKEGMNALRWWIVTERLLPIAKSFCDEQYNHPMCFSIGELREISDSAMLDIDYSIFVNKTEVTQQQPKPKPAPRQERPVRVDWDGPCPGHMRYACL
jgi:hypothetical protein